MIATISLDDVILFIGITAFEVDLLGGKRGIQFDGVEGLKDLLLGKVHQCFSEALTLMIRKNEETVDVVFGDGDGSDGGAIDSKEIYEAVFNIRYDPVHGVVRAEEFDCTCRIVFWIYRADSCLGDF